MRIRSVVSEGVVPTAKIWDVSQILDIFFSIVLGCLLIQNKSSKNNCFCENT